MDHFFSMPNLFVCALYVFLLKETDYILSVGRREGPLPCWSSRRLQDAFCFLHNFWEARVCGVLEDIKKQWYDSCLGSGFTLAGIV